MFCLCVLNFLLVLFGLLVLEGVNLNLGQVLVHFHNNFKKWKLHTNLSTGLRRSTLKLQYVYNQHLKNYQNKKWNT